MFLNLTTIRTGEKILANKDNIIFVRPQPNGDGSYLYCIGGVTEAVKESLDDIEFESKGRSSERD